MKLKKTLGLGLALLMGFTATCGVSCKNNKNSTSTSTSSSTTPVSPTVPTEDVILSWEKISDLKKDTTLVFGLDTDDKVFNLHASGKLNGADATIVYSSSNKDVAEITANKLTVVGIGVTEIRAHVQGASSTDKDLVFNLTVIDKPRIEVSASSIVVKPDATYQLETKIFNTDTYQDVYLTYTSSDSTVVTVESTSGLVTGIKEGSAEITVSLISETTATGKKVLATDKVKVTVSGTASLIYESEETEVIVEKEGTKELSFKVFNLDEDEIKSAKVKADSAEASLFTVESSVLDSATNTVTVVIKGVNSGTGQVNVTLTYTPKGATEEQVLETSVNVRVANNITIDSIETVTMNYGETHNLTPVIKVNGVDATSDQVSFAIEDTSIATVNESGSVTAISNGITNIIISVCDGEKVVKVKLIVKSLILVTLDPTTKTEIFEDEKLQLNYTVTENGQAITSPVIEYSVTGGVATIDKHGLLTPNSYGTVEVTASYLTGVSEVFTLTIKCRPTIEKVAGKDLDLNWNQVTAKQHTDEEIVTYFHVVKRDEPSYSTTLSVRVVDGIEEDWTARKDGQYGIELYAPSDASVKALRLDVKILTNIDSLVYYFYDVSEETRYATLNELWAWGSTQGSSSYSITGLVDPTSAPENYAFREIVTMKKGEQDKKILKFEIRTDLEYKMFKDSWNNAAASAAHGKVDFSRVDKGVIIKQTNGLGDQTNDFVFDYDQLIAQEDPKIYLIAGQFQDDDIKPEEVNNVFYNETDFINSLADLSQVKKVKFAYNAGGCTGWMTSIWSASGGGNMTFTEKERVTIGGKEYTVGEFNNLAHLADFYLKDTGNTKQCHITLNINYLATNVSEDGTVCIVVDIPDYYSLGWESENVTWTCNYTVTFFESTPDPEPEVPVEPETPSATR